MTLDFHHKIIVPIVHRFEARAFQFIIYGLNQAEFPKTSVLSEITARLVARGFPESDWAIVWGAVHAEAFDYRWLSMGGKVSYRRHK